MFLLLEVIRDLPWSWQAVVSLWWPYQGSMIRAHRVSIKSSEPFTAKTSKPGHRKKPSECIRTNPLKPRILYSCMLRMATRRLNWYLSIEILLKTWKNRELSTLKHLTKMGIHFAKATKKPVMSSQNSSQSARKYKLKQEMPLRLIKTTTELSKTKPKLKRG